MKHVLVFAIALAATSHVARASGNAPFCVVTSYGENCWYYDANQCADQATRQRGMCLHKGQAQQQPANNPLDISGSYQQGYSFGQQMRLQREEHEAKMALYKAQAEAANPQPAAVTAPVVYRCPGAGEDGKDLFTAAPQVGCVVVAIYGQ